MTAQQQALAILDRQVTVQSSMLAFSKIYWYSGLVLIGGTCVPAFSCYSETGRARGYSKVPVHWRPARALAVQGKKPAQQGDFTRIFRPIPGPRPAAVRPSTVDRTSSMHF